MESSRSFFLCFLISLLTFHFFPPPSIAQLSPSETGTLFEIQQLLEYPEAFQDWNNSTDFCHLPPSPFLVIACSGNRVTELTVTGNKPSPSQIATKPTSRKNPPFPNQTLSGNFSIVSIFATLTNLTSLKILSLVSLGLWGPLPPVIDQLNSLQVLNISSNFIYGEIPASISSMKNLTSLCLSGNLLNGSVPDLAPLQSLQVLDLGVNQLGPAFPSLGPALVNITLRNNSMISEIPSTIASFDLLQRFDVSFNQLVGPIPPALFSLPSIQYLVLRYNQLSGALPVNTLTCSGNLTYVDISENYLTGNLPACIGSGSGNRTVLSYWNCLSGGVSSRYQHNVSFCDKAVALTVQPSDGRQNGQTKSKLGVILGVIVGFVGAGGVVGLVILVIIIKAKRSNNKGRSSIKCDSFVVDKTPSVRGSPVVDGRHVPRGIKSPTLGLPPYHVFKLEDMEDATNNFDPANLAGEGSHGQLYKGCLRDGSTAMVKCLKLKQKHSQQNLQQHMEVISKLRHNHLVSVVGHCIVTYQDHPNTAMTLFLVLENVANGSLRDHLTDSKKREYLQWPQRMGITMGIARGIQFLHTGIAPGVFGNDLKIENILLDDSLTAKISSYNISLPSKVGSESPLNRQDASNRLSSTENPEKNDIYQLGVILLEVITGKPITSESEADNLKYQLEKALAESTSKLQELIDPSLRGTFAYESMKTAVEISTKCLCEDPSARPTIEDVVWHLQYSMQVQQGWSTTSGNLSTKF
ncbi:probable LRR receptor-like serine/threonine-protein kinase At1g14390 [Rhododendron vialii]|uniref:probable LRR receptor-like serine/threonine-protein kinase At1g14390 n=1 Tax=Rhododendron vialii TaxID=182163 RepID=UPI00265E33F0|nr:probable LRR receptor-like serine/threonine-protein kinase At1g14390 [Rhododendron vialii]XP_058194812.1 probable LRR receptor-like serine/threonine-protein kinase At1g14390 [Rhododendron vialii]